MTASIRSLCLAALLAAGSAWAQQPADNPDNPHSTKARDKQGSDVPASTTNQQADQAEKANPHRPDNRDAKPAGTASTSEIDAAERDNPHDTQNKDRDRLGSPSAMGHDQMSGMDQEAMTKNATPQMMLQKLHASNLHEIEMGKMAEQNGTEKVKPYAQTLERDHQDADRKVTDVAKKKGISLSDAPKDPQMRQQMDEAKQRFSSMKGAEFDRAFANRMSKEHKKLIAVAQGWRRDCKDQDVCSLIDALMPKLQQHAQMADQLKGPAPMGRAPENPANR